MLFIIKWLFLKLSLVIWVSAIQFNEQNSCCYLLTNWKLQSVIQLSPFARDFHENYCIINSFFFGQLTGPLVIDVIVGFEAVVKTADKLDLY